MYFLKESVTLKKLHGHHAASNSLMITNGFPPISLLIYNYDYLVISHLTLNNPRRHCLIITQIISPPTEQIEKFF
jgi:hypothetical protein